MVHTFCPLRTKRAVVLNDRARLHRGQVRAGGRLAEQLAPDLVAVEHRAEVARLLLVAAVGDQARAEHADADDVEDARDAGAAELLVDDDLLDRAQTLAAELLRPGDAGQPALGELALPRAARGQVSGVFGPARVERTSGAWRLWASSQLRTFSRYAACSGVSLRSTLVSSFG